MSDKDITRLNVNLNAATAAELKRLADEHRMPLNEVVRRSISVYSWIIGEVEQGRKIISERNEIDSRELIIPDRNEGGGQRWDGLK